ncbi:MAG: PHP-associated domain-containing protein [Chloroflexia bacterium]
MLRRFDLHLHTEASPDSLLSPAELLEVCLRKGLAGVAITDHDTIAGALEVLRLTPAGLQIIVGEEVASLQGEVLGLFLRKEVPAAMDVWATARAIRAQGGLVGVPHPCDSWRHVLPLEVVEELARAGLLDFVEGRNGRVLRQENNHRAEALGRRLALPLTAGSDAHSVWEVGACTVLLPAFSGPQEFLAALARGRLLGRPSPPWSKVGSVVARLRRYGRSALRPQTPGGS